MALEGRGHWTFPAGRTLEAGKGFMAVWHVGELLQRPLQQGWVGPVQMQGTGLCECGLQVCDCGVQVCVDAGYRPV